MTQQEEFEALYMLYWQYVYKYEVRYPNDFEPDTYNCYNDDFKEQLHEEGMTIKVNDGY